MKEIAVNKSATFEYFVEDRFEAGIELKGTEAKSAREGNVSLKESFVFIRDGEMWLKNSNIAPYKQGSIFNVEQKRDRKLLMKKDEIARLFGKVSEKGYTLIVTKLYLVGSLIKAEVALCKGKQLYDKRRTIKDREQNRAVSRELKEYNR